MRPGPGGATDIWPAGWPLRHFTLGELGDLIAADPPRLLEISKDLIRDDLSVKALATALEALPANCRRAYAGTTDLVECNGFAWERYRDYLAIQVAQARFLECDLFRVLVGEQSPHVGTSEVARRLGDLCRDLAPIQACVEIHGGIESDLEVLAELLRLTPIMFVVDFENMHRAGHTTDTLLEALPRDRVAYFHQRNLPGVWTEHEASIDDEPRWRERFPETPFLWEPKKVEDPERVRCLFAEYVS